jgi:hypothetical protein
MLELAARDGTDLQPEVPQECAFRKNGTAVSPIKGQQFR